MASNTVVIAGAGHGGVQVAVTLRQNGFDGRVVLIGDEVGLPYQRPPLSKSYLQGKTGPEMLSLRPAAFYRDNRIELQEGSEIVKIEPSPRRAFLRDGDELQYDHLVLAVGARNRRIDIAGCELDGIFYLRTLAEAEALRPRLAQAEEIVVIGAGFIGLEFAAVASAMGKRVRIVEADARAMVRALGSHTAAFFERWHARQGVEFLFNVKPISVEGASGVIRAVVLTDGRKLTADLMIVSIGVVPNGELANDAGLAVSNGIFVDHNLLTASPDISAIGDCASFPSAFGKRRLRLESVQNATDQARCVANRLTGKIARYLSVPWFWSDQGSLKLQIVGTAEGHTKSVIRGSIESAEFSVFYFKDDALLGIESVNRPSDHMFGRRALAINRYPTPAQAADLDFDLKTCIAA
jgi:3-phenylpropionate/trans-cinnamate dioxygenase ferredoxin reductase subunit